MFPMRPAIMQRLQHLLGWAGIASSVALLLLTLPTYGFQPDHFAAFTLMPIWVWGGLGIAAAVAGAFLARTRPGWILPTLAWLAVVFLVADESRVLANLDHEKPRHGPAAPHEGKPVIRILTANLDLAPADEIITWKPDVVLLQDVFPHQAARIARELYGDAANFRTHETNAILTRWEITAESANTGQRSHQATITRPDGTRFDVVNVHLLSAATDLSLWRRGVWTGHRVNRAIRLDELSRALRPLEDTTANPAILGGDFNAPPGDPVDRRLRPAFRDAHTQAGTRWGNTYHRRFPILRIDRIHATRHFTPVRCATCVARGSDHRFVVADLILEP